MKNENTHLPKMKPMGERIWRTVKSTRRTVVSTWRTVKSIRRTVVS
jgi:hypothetical protein